MSKARSPREVCSTTIGTIGLIAEAVYRSRSPAPTAAATCQNLAAGQSPRKPEAQGDRMKKPLAVVLALAVAIAAGAPALAASKKIRHRGEIVGVADSKVTLRVSKNRGKPTKLSAFKATGVPTRCEEGDFLFSFEPLDPTRVTTKGNFKEVLKNPDGTKLTVSGTVRKGGRKVAGFVKTNHFDGGDTAGECKTPKTRFKTEKV
jgi:hypothetical protein